ncbi:MAG: acyl-CoA synthetase FdrA [Rhodospirillales bacterium]|nr:acyl-CoA synthetase FdrA [Rhodospirillales bacterium]
MVIKSKIWPSLYQDSVILMQIAGRVRARDGIDEAAAFMGTEGNLALLREIGLATPEAESAGPNDLIFVVGAVDAATAERGLDAAHEMLSERRTSASEDDDEEVLPKTLNSALRAANDANLVAISVPGAFAKYEAMRALRRGLHVFLFSDNVPVADEIILKRTALERGLLCMGPDCGTAYLSGQGLGFFNVVPRGSIGCVAAAGTGLQAVVSRIGNLGEGISHGVGVGGRDLSADVGGIMTIAALEAMADDDETNVIVLISKPPHPEVMTKIVDLIGRIAKPVVVCCLGASKPRNVNAAWAATLDQAADMAVSAVRGEVWQDGSNKDLSEAYDKARNILPPGKETPRAVLGLYTGGTLAHEAHLLLKEALGSVGFNGRLTDTDVTHRIVDLGDDTYTVGRPHPMIAPETRTEMIEKAADLPHVGIMVFDLVLGRASHPDPATPLAEVFSAARAKAEADGRNLIGIASVVGTALDPQGLEGQVACLQRAGIVVLPTNSGMAKLAAQLATPEQIGSPAGGRA